MTRANGHTLQSRALRRRLRVALPLLGCLIGHAPSVLAELPQSQRTTSAPPTEAPLLVRLAPTAEQVQRARTRAIEQRLVRLISALPEVERTEVDIDQPLPLDQPLDRPARGPRAAVVIGVMSERSPGQRRDAIERIVSAVLPDLSRDDLTVIERTPAPLRSAPEAATSAHSLVQIGPFLVHPQSAPALRGGLATLLASNALLAGILLWRTRLMRARTARRTES